jgi:hypothetical protein
LLVRDLFVFSTSLKKISTILLLGLLLFNWFGYRLLITCLQDHSRKTLETRLDGNDYDESQLISIKTPVTNLAYYNASGQFERVDGSIEVNGIRYKYVKRRLFKDSLELLCLPDHAAMRLQSFNNDFFGFISGISTPAKRHGAQSVSVKTAMADPYVIEEKILSHQLPLVQLTTGDRYRLFFPSSPTATPERPPATLN